MIARAAALSSCLQYCWPFNFLIVCIYYQGNRFPSNNKCMLKVENKKKCKKKKWICSFFLLNNTKFIVHLLMLKTYFRMTTNRRSVLLSLFHVLNLIIKLYMYTLHGFTHIITQLDNPFTVIVTSKIKDTILNNLSY